MSLKLDGDGDGLSGGRGESRRICRRHRRGDRVRGSGGPTAKRHLHREAPPPSLISGHSCAYTATVWHKAEA